MVVARSRHSAGKSLSSLHFVGEMRHPLLRIAAQYQGTPALYKSFQRLIREALSCVEFSEDRAVLGMKVLDELPKLELEYEGEQAFRAEWLKEMARSTSSPSVLEALAMVQLEEDGLVLEVNAWQIKASPTRSLSLPQLKPSSKAMIRSSISSSASRSPITRSISSTNSFRLPTDVAQSFLGCVNLALVADREKTLSSWGAPDCLAILRSITLLTVYDNLHIDLIRASDRRQFFLDVGAGLWAALVWQLKKLPRDEHYAAFVDGRLLQLVMLHVEGRALLEVTKEFNRLDGQGNLSCGSNEVANTFFGTGSGQLQVIHGPIPLAAHKEDTAALHMYEPLLQPIPVSSMPSPVELEVVLQTLFSEFPWAVGVIDELGVNLRGRSLFGVQDLWLAPTLIVGHPGSGKTRLARRLSELLKLPFLPLSLGGIGDSKPLTGTTRGWAGGEASPLLKVMLQHNSASAMVLLDELDKVSSHSRGSSPITSALLGLLEPESARRWHDNFLQTTCDFGRLSFWATANSLTPIPKPLLSRFTLLYMPAPARQHMLTLVQGITEDIEKEWGLQKGVLPIAPEAIYEKAKLNARELRRLVTRWLNDWGQEVRGAGRLH